MAVIGDSTGKKSSPPKLPEQNDEFSEDESSKISRLDILAIIEYAHQKGIMSTTDILQASFNQLHLLRLQLAHEQRGIKNTHTYNNDTNKFGTYNV